MIHSWLRLHESWSAPLPSTGRGRTGAMERNGMGEAHLKEIWDFEGSSVWRQVRTWSLHPIWESACAHVEPLTNPSGGSTFLYQWLLNTKQFTGQHWWILCLTEVRNPLTIWGDYLVELFYIYLKWSVYIKYEIKELCIKVLSNKTNQCCWWVEKKALKAKANDSGSPVDRDVYPFTLRF